MVKRMTFIQYIHVNKLHSH